jgi:hypothetical protein
MGSRVRIPEHVRSIIDPDGAVLLDLRKGKYFSLNGTGAEIWQALEAGSSVADIEGRLANRYGASPEEARSDINDFVRDLSHKQLLDVRG